ncbi:hypothetical protein E2C01_029558 [Portunus trituberculatus]|uniref:Uncharacterized protein n=1 Tax=Portunus trituberculatus TaxID=210409 RepID=A0A5B7ENQ4_PORTR|nr:hypothetical protein [Portunus trituberculatus]
MRLLDFPSGPDSCAVSLHRHQFYQSSGGNFVHGYAYPHYQVQSGANVPGGVSYLNAYGYPTLLTHPLFGFATNHQNPVAPVGKFRSVPAVETFPAGVPVVSQQDASKSEQDSGRTPLSPLLKMAYDAGFVSVSGISQSGSPLYDVSPFLAEDAGSVSELAYRLEAVPVAAVHDVQRPHGRPAHSFSPVLIHDDNPQVTKYTLEVPVQ